LLGGRCEALGPGLMWAASGLSSRPRREALPARGETDFAVADTWPRLWLSDAAVFRFRGVARQRLGDVSATLLPCLGGLWIAGRGDSAARAREEGPSEQRPQTMLPGLGHAAAADRPEASPRGTVTERSVRKPPSHGPLFTSPARVMSSAVLATTELPSSL